MDTEILPDGTVKENYYDEIEYASRGRELDKTIGRRQIIYEGWLKGKLVRMFRG